MDMQDVLGDVLVGEYNTEYTRLEKEYLCSKLNFIDGELIDKFRRSLNHNLQLWKGEEDEELYFYEYLQIINEKFK